MGLDATTDGGHGKTLIRKVAWLSMAIIGSSSRMRMVGLVMLEYRTFTPLPEIAT